MYEIIEKGFLSSYRIASRIKESVYEEILKFNINEHFYPSNYVAGILCEESSSRTRFSTESAILKLGGKVIHFSSLEETSIKKGETLEESARLWSHYFDLLAVRSKKEYLPFILNRYSTIPVINLGDGANEHPTQALATLVHVFSRFGKIAGINICLWGDFLKSRTMHSVAIAFATLGANVFIYPIPMEASIVYTVKQIRRRVFDSNIRIINSINEMPKEINVFYLTRLQKERWEDCPQYSIFDENYFSFMSSNGIILHPLPHGDEIDEDILTCPQSAIIKHISITQQTRQWLFYSYKKAYDENLKVIDNNDYYERLLGDEY